MQNCKISAEIVLENILLSSKSSLKMCRTVLNMTEDKATIFIKELIFTSKHQWPLFCRYTEFSDNDQVENILVLEVHLSHKEK